jgi:hypothetical protein
MWRLCRTLDRENVWVRARRGMEVEIGQEEDGRDGGQPCRQRRSRDCEKHLDKFNMRSYDLPVVMCVLSYSSSTHTSGAVSLIHKLAVSPQLRRQGPMPSETASFFHLGVKTHSTLLTTSSIGAQSYAGNGMYPTGQHVVPMIFILSRRSCMP